LDFVELKDEMKITRSSDKERHVLDSTDGEKDEAPVPRNSTMTPAPDSLKA
jgi:hypothetical protein